MLLAKSGQLPHLMCTTPVFSWSKPQTIIFKSTREDQSWAQKHFHTSPKWKLAQGWEKKKSSVKMTQILLSVDISCEILYSRTSLKLGLQFLLRKDLIYYHYKSFQMLLSQKKTKCVQIWYVQIIVGPKSSMLPSVWFVYFRNKNKQYSRPYCVWNVSYPILSSFL